MKITSCDIWPVKLTLEEPFSIAYMTIDHTINVFIRISTDEGIIGFGCGGHDQEVTGENGETIERTLREVAEPMLKGEDPLCWTMLTERIRSCIPQQPTALAAVDMALMDIAAKKAGMPLYRMLGGVLKPVPTSITIGIQSIDQTLERAVHWKKKGFSTLKIKGGNNLDEDIEKIVRIRETVGKEMGIFLDANQGYTYQEARACIRVLAENGGLCIEQPCPREDLNQFTEIKRELENLVPIMADESVLGPEDALKLIQTGSADMINIKLAKSGGVRRALQTDALAQAAGVPTMMGSMDESGLGIAAGVHTLLSSPNCRYADLDGALEFIDDPAADAVILKNGTLMPSQRPGLGFDL
jgi:L-alanine-DL-glutamate epimerase-like enolase superfamily enzyme